ncbi:MAG: helix-turn-helix domain-containing protein [Rhodoblastus sp.]|nr:MAG: helix-turn-helix domain-containing protein [Rhodoblastus sp.]
MRAKPCEGLHAASCDLPRGSGGGSSADATSTEILSIVNRTSVGPFSNHWRMDVNARIRAARIAAGFRSAQEAARRFGWTPSTYASHENGQTRTPSLEVIEAYAAAFKVAPEYLAFGSNSKSETSIPVLGVVGAGDHVNIIPEDGNAIDWLTGPPLRLFAVIVKGGSMEPVYREGDALFRSADFAHGGGRP